jgi:peptidoglycan/LPS O-acetylase OafA/YrhL
MMARFEGTQAKEGSPKLPKNTQCNQASVRNGRWEFLDACRGIAALLVLFQHTAERNHGFYAFSSRYFNAGEMGVVTFFLVSGYIIPASLERYGSVIRFWIGRAFRLLPVYWVSFVALLVLEYFRQTLSSSFLSNPARYILGNLAMMQGILHVPYGFEIYWTLSYEALFYVVCTLLFLTQVLRYSRVWAIVVPSLFLAANVGYALILHRAFSAEKFGVVATAFIGTLIYRYSVGASKRHDVFVALAIMVPAVVVANWLRLGVYSGKGSAVPNDPLSGDLSFLLGYVAFGIMFALRARQFPQPLVMLGKISYSVYLWHAIVLRCLPHSMNVFLQMFLCFTLTLIISVLSFRFIEEPALGIQRRLFPHKAQIPPDPAPLAFPFVPAEQR